MPDIRFDQGDTGTVNRSRSDITISVAVTVNALAVVGTAIFGLLDRPTGSSAVLAGAGSTRTITPDVAGTYRVRIIDDNDDSRVLHTFTVRTAQRAMIIPSHNERASTDANEVDADPGDWVDLSETNEGSSDKGWHPGVEELFRLVDLSIGQEASDQLINVTPKTSLVDADTFLAEDSQLSGAKVAVTAKTLDTMARQDVTSGILGGGNIIPGAGAGQFTIETGRARTISYSQPLAPIINGGAGAFAFGPFTDITPINLATEAVTFLAIENGTGTPTLVQQNTAFSDSQRRAMAVLGHVLHLDNTTITSIGAIPDLAYGSGMSFRDFIRAIEPYIRSGGAVTGNANLTMDTASGSAYVEGGNFHVNADVPDIVPISAQSPLSFARVFSDGVQGGSLELETISTTLLDPLQFEPGGLGVLASVSAAAGGARATVQALYASIVGSSLAYGQIEYQSLSDAISGVNTEEALAIRPALLQESILLGWWCVEQGTTDLSSLRAQFVPKTGGASSGGGGGGGEVNTNINLVDPDTATQAGIAASKVGVVNELKVIQSGVNTSVVGDANNVLVDVTGSPVVRTSENQTAHGFALGAALYKTSPGGVFTLAQSNSADTLGLWLVTEVIDVDNFRISHSGTFTLTAHGFTIGEYLFVSDTVAGDLIDTEPTISNLIAFVADANTLLVLPFRPVNTGGGGTTGDSIFDAQSQTAHGLLINTPVFLLGGLWTAADSDDAATLATGVVSEVVDVNNLVVTMAGKFTSTAHGFTINDLLYTSPTGTLTPTRPAALEFDNPIAFVYDANTLLVLPWKYERDPEQLVRLRLGSSTTPTSVSTAHSFQASPVTGTHIKIGNNTIGCYNSTPIPTSLDLDSLRLRLNSDNAALLQFRHPNTIALSANISQQISYQSDGGSNLVHARLGFNGSSGFEILNNKTGTGNRDFNFTFADTTAAAISQRLVATSAVDATDTSTDHALQVGVAGANRIAISPTRFQSLTAADAPASLNWQMLTLTIESESQVPHRFRRVGASVPLANNYNQRFNFETDNGALVHGSFGFAGGEGFRVQNNKTGTTNRNTNFTFADTTAAAISQRFVATSEVDADLTSTDHALQVGPDGAFRIKLSPGVFQVVNAVDAPGNFRFQAAQIRLIPTIRVRIETDNGEPLSLEDPATVALSANFTQRLDFQSDGGTLRHGNIGFNGSDGFRIINNKTGTGNGQIRLENSQPDTLPLMELVQTGTGGATSQVHTGTTSPSGRVSAPGGSLFVQVSGATSNMFINRSVGTGTTWVAFI